MLTARGSPWPHDAGGTKAPDSDYGGHIHPGRPGGRSAPKRNRDAEHLYIRRVCCLPARLHTLWREQGDSDAERVPRHLLDKWQLEHDVVAGHLRVVLPAV